VNWKTVGVACARAPKFEKFGSNEPERMTEHEYHANLATSKWLQWHSSPNVDVLMPQSPPPRSLLPKSRISENAARVGVSLADGSTTSMSEGAAMHAALFRRMLAASAFKEARERHVDLSAHDADIARLVIEFLETEFECNGTFPLARPRVAFHFPIAPEQVFDVLHAAAYFEIAELTKLCVSMYRDFVRDELVDADAVALLPPPVLAEIAVGFEETELRSFASFLGEEVTQAMLTLRAAQLHAADEKQKQERARQSPTQEHAQQAAQSRRPLSYI
jgi:hypothetical protein